MLNIFSDGSKGQLIYTSHNLRDYYFTDIVFGEQEVETYQKTNKYEIALVLHNAGIIDG